MKTRAIIISMLAAALAMAAAGIWWCVGRVRTAMRVAERREFLARFGITSDGTREFEPLPDSLTHNAAAARLGASLFVDRRLAQNPYRACGACHRLNEGGIDARALGGSLPRTVYNAIFADVFLHDGSVTGMPALVRRMIESPKFCDGGPLSNIVANLAADEKTLTCFQFAYDDGVTASNVVDALVQHQRTLFSSGRPFDAWCIGRTDMLDARQKEGFEIFKARKCGSCHYGPALGLLKVADGRKVAGLRGLGQRRAYLPDARTDLGAVLPLMPGGDMEPDERTALVAFLKSL